MEESKEGKEQKPELAAEILGTKSELIKIYSTFLQSIKDVKIVADDYYTNKGNYTKPLKYALTLIAPYVLFAQIIGMKGFSSGYDSDENIGFKSAEINSFFIKLDEVNLAIGGIIDEAEPLFYAVFLVPILAFWMKLFFNRNNLAFTYYYGLGIYLLITIIVILYPLDFLSHFGIESDYLYFGIFSIFFFYSIYKAFKGNALVSILKSVLILGLSALSAAVIFMIVGSLITVIIL